MKKNLSGEGAIMLGIEKDALGAQIRKLKPTNKTKPISPDQETAKSIGSPTSMEDKIKLFKDAEKGKFPCLISIRTLNLAFYVLWNSRVGTGMQNTVKGY